MANELDISVVLEQLEERVKEEDDKYILETLNFEIGYLVCLIEHDIEDGPKLKSIQDYLLETA